MSEGHDRTAIKAVWEEFGRYFRLSPQRHNCEITIVLPHLTLTELQQITHASIHFERGIKELVDSASEDLGFGRPRYLLNWAHNDHLRQKERSEVLDALSSTENFGDLCAITCPPLDAHPRTRWGFSLARLGTTDSLGVTIRWFSNFQNLEDALRKVFWAKCFVTASIRCPNKEVLMGIPSNKEGLSNFVGSPLWAEEDGKLKFFKFFRQP